MQLFSTTGLYWLWIAIVVLIIDCGSKLLILQNFTFGDTMHLFPLLNLHYARNYGAAFSFLSRSKESWKLLFFSGVTIFVCTVLMVVMYHSKISQRLSNIAYALIIGGALGNLFDRLYNGFVVDMIDIYIINWHFATFNLADCAIFVGSTLIALNGSLLKITEIK